MVPLADEHESETKACNYDTTGGTTRTDPFTSTNAFDQEAQSRQIVKPARIAT